MNEENPSTTAHTGCKNGAAFYVDNSSDGGCQSVRPSSRISSHRQTQSSWNQGGRYAARISPTAQASPRIGFNSPYEYEVAARISTYSLKAKATNLRVVPALYTCTHSLSPGADASEHTQTVIKCKRSYIDRHIRVQSREVSLERKGKRVWGSGKPQEICENKQGI